MSPTSSPIFSKTYNFILWLLNHTEGFPRSERFRLARRLEDTTFTFYENLVEATRHGNRLHHLSQADLDLHKLRLYLRLSQSRCLTSLDQYHYAASCLEEIGKLLGGWLKKGGQAVIVPAGSNG